jgi:hypothetical protein
MLHRGVGTRFSALVFLFVAWIISPTSLGEVDAAPLSMSATSDQIVQRMLDSNEKRARNLQHYTEDRHYQVEFRGFPAIAASIDVQVTYDAPASKNFRVLSQTGSTLLVDLVLKKLLESEKEAAKNPDQIALTPENYVFALVGTEDSADQKLFIFHVEPRVNRKFLYRGTIWVDAKDYAVAKIEAEPARNPSFWIKRTQIHHVYSKTGDFWLPERNRSETVVRLGGTAILTINYGSYQIRAARS